MILFTETQGFLTCHAGDRKWVLEQLAPLTGPIRDNAMRRYSKTYGEVLAAREGRIDAESVARREANNEIRQYLQRMSYNSAGKVTKPPAHRVGGLNQG